MGREAERGAGEPPAHGPAPQPFPRKQPLRRAPSTVPLASGLQSWSPDEIGKAPPRRHCRLRRGRRTCPSASDRVALQRRDPGSRRQESRTRRADQSGKIELLRSASDVVTTPAPCADAAAARDVSVLICTFNRADRLDETLATLAVSRVPNDLVGSDRRRQQPRRMEREQS